uniref:Uncharacterized protein n=1 Tax=Arion vulgaris TaxID=1028688 RepID=A0A0B7AFS6_9EUPU
MFKDLKPELTKLTDIIAPGFTPYSSAPLHRNGTLALESITTNSIAPAATLSVSGKKYIRKQNNTVKI